MGTKTATITLTATEWARVVGCLAAAENVPGLAGRGFGPLAGRIFHETNRQLEPELAPEPEEDTPLEGLEVEAVTFRSHPRQAGKRRQGEAWIREALKQPGDGCVVESSPSGATCHRHGSSWPHPGPFDGADVVGNVHEVGQPAGGEPTSPRESE